VQHHYFTFSARNWHSRTRRRKPFHIEKVYAFFMNFLPALYEFSGVIKVWPLKEGGEKCDLSIQSDWANRN